DVAVLQTASLQPDAEPVVGRVAQQGEAALIPAGSAVLAIAEPALPAGTNPYLDRINASAESIGRMLQARTVQLAQLEQQVNAMRIRMEEARSIAVTLNAALRVALENRAAREAA